MVKQKASVVDALKDVATQPLHVPFSNHATSLSVTQGHTVNATRILEAVIIALLSSMSTYISSIPRLEAQIAKQAETIIEIKTALSEIKRDFYIPFGRQSAPRTDTLKGGDTSG